MATTSLQSLHHPFLHHHHHHHHHLSLKPTNILLPPTTTTSSLLTTTTPTTSSSFDALAHHLSASNFREADEETRRLIVSLAGEPAQQRGYVFFSEVQFISPTDFLCIDELWRHHSANRFGYSVQRRLWDKSKRDFTNFFIRIGWMKKLESEVEQFNYRAFPDEFMWELTEDTPEGHLPLTNALRGTQLLGCILTHPAFEVEGGADSNDDERGGDGMRLREEGEVKGKQSVIRGKRSLNPDYSF